MGRVTVPIGGRSYALSCADGEETHLAMLADLLRQKADELTAAIGSMSEPRLLLMAGLQVADELVTLRNAAPGGSDKGLHTILGRVEALAALLEK